MTPCSCIPVDLKKWLILPVITALTLSACGSDSAGEEEEELGAVSEQLSEALDYVNESLPDLGNSVGATVRLREPARLRSLLDVGILTTNFITPTVWGSATVSDQIAPPGGSVFAGETYNGGALPSTVNYRDFIKMSLDADYSRSDGSSVFRPSVFGRFDQLVDGMTYIEQSGIPTAANGQPEVGSHTGTLTVDGTAVALEVDVTASASAANYSRNMDVRGYVDANSNGLVDTGETQAFHNLIWLKATSTQLNMMLTELRDANNDGALDNFAVNMLNWNRSTGNLRFERASVPNDSTGNAVDTSRILIESTGGKAWVYSFEAVAGAAGFTQWGLYTPAVTATQGTVSIRDVRSNGDIWMGNICATFASGVGVAGDTISGDVEDPASGGTCAGQLDALNIKGGTMYPGFQVQQYITWDQLATAKSFPFLTAGDWSSDSNRAAWLTAGELVGPAFTNKTQFIGSF